MNGLWVAGAWLLLAAVLAIDLLVPLGVAQGALYVLPVLLAVIARSRRLLATLGILAAVLVAAVFAWQYPPPEGVPPAFVVANRTISLVAIAVAVALGKTLLDRFDTLSKTRYELDNKQRLLDMAGSAARFGAWLLDNRTGSVEVTDEVARILEVDNDRPLELDAVIKQYVPEHREAVSRAVERCLREGVPYDEEWELERARSGRRVWVRTIGEPIFGDHGNIVGAQGSFQDINARKRAEQNAELTQERFRQLADAMPVFVWTATAEGHMDFLNRFGLEYTGVENLEAVLGGKWLSRAHPDDREATIIAWQKAIASGRDYSNDFRLKRHDGAYRLHRASAKPIRNRRGETESWFGCCIDIEEQTRLAERLHRTLESMADAFFAFDHEWRFIYVNSQGEKQSGLSRDELLGQVVWDRFPEARDLAHYQRYREAVETRQTVHFTEYYEPLDIWVEVSAYPTEYGLAVHQRDITAQRRIEEQTRQSQRLESIGQLTGGIAHDFNNLLTVIGGNAQLLAESIDGNEHLQDGNEHLQELTGMIRDAAERGADLIGRLLAFARKQRLEPAVVDINDLVNGMEELLRRALGEHIELDLVRAPGLWSAMIDSGQLEDALLNLCINARDAMPGGGALKIETFNAPLDSELAAGQAEIEPGDYVGLSVSDTGRGIEPELLPRVFDPFFTTKQEDQGTGLGLAMVYGFVKQSGGHVRIDSRPDRGTTVRLLLPRTERSAEPASSETGSRTGGDETVLLVEDDDLVRRVTAMQLQSLGYEVIEAENGPDALEQLAAHPEVDLLFTDVVMPGNMGGPELAEQACRNRPALRVLYASGYTENAFARHGGLEPNVQLLSKPYRRDQLAQAVRRALS